MELWMNGRTLIIDEANLIRVQARWRGAVVRNKMGKLKNIYHSCIKSIEEVEKPTTWRGPTLFLPILPTYAKKALEPTAQSTPVKNVRISPSISYEDENFTDSDKPVKIGKDAAEKLENSSSDRTERTNSSQRTKSPVAKHKGASRSSDISVSDRGKESDSSRESRKKNSRSASDSIDVRDNTSVWDTMEASQFTAQQNDLTGMTREELEDEKNQLAMELLWIQQAVHSRKEYLRMKMQLSARTLAS